MAPALSEADLQRLEAITDPRARFLAAHATLSPYLSARVGARRDPLYQRLRRIRGLALLEHVDRAAEVGARVNFTALAAAADPPVTRQALHYLLAEARALPQTPSARRCLNCGRELAPGEGPYCTDTVGCEAERQGRLRLAEQADAERDGIPLDVPGDP